ncbi:universal stress protein [Acrocarpospora sp. B8E8]|uniref:universal stress protein n=1 Tax=Acrocarpospora sp. B8E8 TaxID=3153572 RepID=UPI00325C9B05
MDETAGCEPALEYAFEQARLGQQMLRAVHAWQEPEHACAPWIGYDLEELGALKRDFTAGRIDVWRPKYPEITVVADVRRGHPVDVLVEASVSADLLVVGAHGKSANSAALGSVSGGVLYRASCPVVVVRCRKEGRDND